MVVKIIGKEELKGHSKRTDRDYHFINVYFNAKVRGVVGLRAERLLIDPAMYDYNSIVVDANYEVEFDQRGQLVGFSKV